MDVSFNVFIDRSLSTTTPPSFLVYSYKRTPEWFSRLRVVMTLGDPNPSDERPWGRRSSTQKQVHTPNESEVKTDSVQDVRHFCFGVLRRFESYVLIPLVNDFMFGFPLQEQKKFPFLVWLRNPRTWFVAVVGIPTTIFTFKGRGSV